MPTINDNPTALAINTISDNFRSIVKLVGGLKQWTKNNNPYPVNLTPPANKVIVKVITANTPIANALVYTKIYDTDNAFNLTTNIFTAPKTTNYKIVSKAMFAGSCSSVTGNLPYTVTIGSETINGVLLHNASNSTAQAFVDVSEDYHRIVALTVGDQVSFNLTTSNGNISSKKSLVTINEI